MFITKQKDLERFYDSQRIWQGIPAIEVTKSGRIFSAFYSGGIDEEIGNFVVLIKSDDGVNFSNPIAAAHRDDIRCFDECLWIDPLGRLWFMWSVYPNCGTWAVICDNPDADELVWSDEFFVAHDVILNKPVVLSSGEWIFPVSVWSENVWKMIPERRTEQTELGAFAYKTTDNGKTFEKLGGVNHPDCTFDEHTIVELSDKRLMMYIRTKRGTGVSYSYDKGKTWTEGMDSGLGGPCTRVHISRLKSGRLLLINHGKDTSYPRRPERKTITAFLSEDDGKSWPYELVLDERANVSYPDATEADDGYIYITYDRERGNGGVRNIDEVYEQAREILYARISEQDIIEGKLVCDGSKLKCVINKLGVYEGNIDCFINPKRHYEFAKYYSGFEPEKAFYCVCERIFAENKKYTKRDYERLDELFEELCRGEEKEETLRLICNLLYSGTKSVEWVVDAVRNTLDKMTNKPNENEVAKELEISLHYLRYGVKKITGITLKEYIESVFET